MASLLSFLLASMGLTIMVVWPQDGPGAWVRERVLRRLLPGKAKEVLDCYICTSYWTGLALSPLWWWMCQGRWAWAGCLMTPPVFWIALRIPGGSERTEHDGEAKDSRWLAAGPSGRKSSVLGRAPMPGDER